MNVMRSRSEIRSVGMYNTRIENDDVGVVFNY